MADEQRYEVMVDTYGWGVPEDGTQFVRGDVITKADAKGFDIDWAVKMGSVRKMKQIEVDALEANEDDSGNNISFNTVTGLLSTVRTFDSEAELLEAEEAEEEAEEEAAARPSPAATAAATPSTSASRDGDKKN